MKNLPKPLTSPWAISIEGLQLVLSVWSRGELFAERRLEALAARAGEPMKNDRKLDTRGAVAVIPIDGPLMRHASIFSDISGATSYEGIRRDLQAALADSAVASILLDVNSPGGEVDGVGELADAIRAAGAIKPITAYIGGTGASAAYWLASAASRVVCAETAMVGSIGVRIALVDDTEKDAKAGSKSVEIVSSQSPDKRSTPIDDELLGRLQSRADELAAIFIASVARNRGVTTAKVESDFGRGDVLIGANAVEAGLVDALGSFEGTLAALAARSSVTRPSLYGAKAITRTKEKKMDGAEAGMPGEVVTAEAAASVAAIAAEAAQFQAQVLALVGATNVQEALGKIGSGASALAELVTEKAARQKAEAEGRKRDFRAVLERGLTAKGDQAPKLSLGAIQNVVPLFVADEGKRAEMLAAAKSIETVTRDGLLDAVCAIDITPSDLRAVQAYAASVSPIAAEVAHEPERNAEKEAGEMNEMEQKIVKAAAEARATLDRGQRAATK